MLDRVYDPLSAINDDPVSSALKGAAITGAVGLVVSHQPWGRRASRFFGRIIDTSKRTLKSMESIRQGQGISYYTKTDFKKLFGAIENNWRLSPQTVDRLALNVSNNGSLANYIRSVETTVARAKSYAQEAWRNDYLLKDALDEMSRQGFDRGTEDNVASFLKKAVRNAENFARNMELARQHRLRDNALSFAEQISKRIQKRHHDAIAAGTGRDADIIEKIQKAVEHDVKKTAYSIDTMERALGTGESQNIMDKSIALLTRAHKMTWREVKDIDKHIEDGLFEVEGKQISVKKKMEEIEDLIKQSGGESAHDRLMRLVVDESNLFMTSEGNAFSKQAGGELWRAFLAKARNTLPGKLFKVGDIDNALKIPALQMMNVHVRDPVAHAKFKKMGEDDKYHFRIGQGIYTLDIDAPEGSRVSYNAELNKGIKIVSGRYGFYHTQIESLAGKTKTSLSDNWLFRKLDIFQDREEYSGDLILNKLSMFIGQNSRKKRFGEQLNMSPEYKDRYQRAVHELATYSTNGGTFTTDLSEDTKDFVLEYMETARKISEIFKTNTYVLPLGAVEEILKSSKLNDQSRKLFELLLRDNTQEMVSAFTSRKAPGLLKQQTAMSAGEYVNYLSSDLRNLIHASVEYPDITENKISLVTNELRLSYGSDLINLFRTPMTNTTYAYDQVLRREIAKEALLRQGLDITPHILPNKIEVKYDRINELLQDINLNDKNAKEADKLAQFSIWQYHTRVTSKPLPDDLLYVDYLDRIRATHELLRGTDETAQHFQSTYRTMMGDEISWLEGELTSETPGVEILEDNVIVNEATSPWDIVKSLNYAILDRDTTSLRNDISNIVKGLSANRDDMSNANLYTFVPFFALKRLSDELNKVGLGFSAESTKSVGDLAMSFMTKRILPIAAGVTYLDWGDDLTKKGTGTGLWEALTSGVANVDLSVRKLISGLGADDWLKQAKSVNPIWQYWGDKDDYQSYEERKEYYENGYTPVRKAAW